VGQVSFVLGVSGGGIVDVEDPAVGATAGWELYTLPLDVVVSYHWVLETRP